MKKTSPWMNGLRHRLVKRLGLTLVEVLVTLVVLTLLTTTLVGIMTMVFRYWRKTNVHVQAEENCRTAMQALCNDFRQATYTTSDGILITPTVPAALGTSTADSASGTATTFEFFVMDGTGALSSVSPNNLSATASYDHIQWVITTSGSTVSLVRNNLTSGHSGTVVSTSTGTLEFAISDTGSSTLVHIHVHTSEDNTNTQETAFYDLDADQSAFASGF